MCYRYLKHTDVSPMEIECVSHAVNNRVLASAKTHGFVSVENRVFYLQPTTECWLLLKHTVVQ